MPRFYFDVCEDDTHIPDVEGEELPDVTAAEREATRAAAQLGQERLNGAGKLSVVVRDADGQPVLHAYISLDVVRLSQHSSC
jgi:hypothetical protein